MIKYLENNISSTNSITLGQRFMIIGNPITCVDIDEDKYIFSMDEIFQCASHGDIDDILKQLWNTGKLNDKDVLPVSMMKEIDFLFIPSEYQVFGENYHGEQENLAIKQFEWYKRGDIVRVKGYRGTDNSNYEDGETCPYWLKNSNSSDSDYCCLVTAYGHTGTTPTNNKDYIGIPVFFQIAKSKGDILYDYRR